MKQQVMQFLDTIQSPAKSLGLVRMKSLMKKLGNPQDGLKIIHVAGTNGKGSVCAMLNAVLMEAGYTVGLFTSPHLIDYNERIQIQGTPISHEDFGAIGMQVKAACLEMEEEGQEMPRFFDFITAMAFLYFAQQDLDLVILETGIGGRYDATNIIQGPLLSIITSIGKDHMSFLGDTIDQISREKGGIIKDNCPTVLYDSGNSVYNIIKDICQNKKSPLLSCRDSIFTDATYNMDGTRFTVENLNFTGREKGVYKNIELQLLGKYQSSNALTSLMAIESLTRSGYNIKDEAIYQGLKKASWPGRMELIQKSPPIIIDGAHNEESAKAFLASLLELAKNKKLTILIGVLKGKDYKAILKILVPFASRIIVSQSTYANALPAQVLYDEIIRMTDHPGLSRLTDLSIEENLIKAYKLGQSTLEEGDVLCCVGSLYLVGELKQFLKYQEENHDQF